MADDDDPAEEEEIGGQWRRQFGLSSTAAEDEDGGQIVATEDGQIVAAAAATDAASQWDDESEAKKRLERLRGGGRGGALSRTPPSRGSSRSASPLPSASPSADGVESPQDFSPQDLLRRIEQHFGTDGRLDQHEVSKLFDELDANSNGFVTESELRMCLERTLFSKPIGGFSEDARHFRHDAEWSGTVAAIESAMPAQFNARKHRVDLNGPDGVEEPVRPSIARLSLTGDKMMEAVEHQSSVAKQVSSPHLILT